MSLRKQLGQNGEKKKEGFRRNIVDLKIVSINTVLFLQIRKDITNS